jgi:hypothetical protein
MGGAHRPSPVDLPRRVHRRRRSRDRLRGLSSHTGTDRVLVAELAGSVVGLTGVFKPGRTSRLNPVVNAGRRSGNRPTPHRKSRSGLTPARGYEYLGIRQPAARNISTIRECYDVGFRTWPGFRLRHDAQRQLVEAGRCSWMRLHRAELDALQVSSCVVPLRGPASILGRESVARFAHVQERRSRYVMIAGRGCRAISAACAVSV